MKSLLDIIGDLKAAESMTTEERSVMARMRGRQRASDVRLLLELMPREIRESSKLNEIRFDRSLAEAAHSLGSVLSGLTFDEQVALLRVEIGAADEEWQKYLAEKRAKDPTAVRS
jgi:hypothetical protein